MLLSVNVQSLPFCSDNDESIHTYDGICCLCTYVDLFRMFAKYTVVND